MYQITFYKFLIPKSSLILVGLMLFNNAIADLVLTAPPRESLSQANAMYQPIAEQLTKILGEQVVYKRPSGWFDYSKQMRNNKFDIVFDGPHFTAWRIKHLNHIPVATLPGALKFYLVANKSDDEVKSISDLVGQKICGILSPNLGTDLVLAHFSNPVVQPIIYSVSGDMLDVYRNFKQNKCKAAILRDMAYVKLSDEEKQQLSIIYKTTPMPNQAITISPRLKRHSKAVSSFITSSKGANIAEKLLSRYSNKARYFIPVSANKYRGAEKLIEGVVYGW